VARRKFTRTTPSFFDILACELRNSRARVSQSLRTIGIAPVALFGAGFEFRCGAATLFGAPWMVGNVEMRQNVCQRVRELRSLISAVGEQRLQKGKHPKQGRHDENAAIAP
jgi:hypothetical protein